MGASVGEPVGVGVGFDDGAVEGEPADEGGAEAGSVKVLAVRVLGMRAPGPLARQHPVRSPPQDHPSCRLPRVPALRTSRLSTRRHRLVRHLLASASAQGPAAGLRRVRPAAPPCRAQPMLGLLATTPRPALRRWRQPHHQAGRPARLAERPDHPTGHRVLTRTRLHHDHPAGTAPERRALRPSPSASGEGPPIRAIDGAARPCPGILLHWPGPGPARRSGRTAGCRTVPPPQNPCDQQLSPSPRSCCAPANAPAAPGHCRAATSPST